MSAGLGVDLDLGRCGSRWGRSASGRGLALASSPGRQPSGRSLRRRALRGELEQADAAVGADDAELARPCELDVGGGGFEHVGGERLARSTIIVGRRRAIAVPPTMSEREPPVPPPACQRSVSPWTMRIASNGDAEPSASDLRVGGLVALAVAIGCRADA